MSKIIDKEIWKRGRLTGSQLTNALKNAQNLKIRLNLDTQQLG